VDIRLQVRPSVTDGRPAITVIDLLHQERSETSFSEDNARCWKRQLADLAIATISLTGCATVASKPRVATVWPPVVEYSREFQARTAEELALLPEVSAVAEMLADYAVMREQARSC
jgi:hypothetical protein